MRVRLSLATVKTLIPERSVRVHYLAQHHATHITQIFQQSARIEQLEGIELGPLLVRLATDSAGARSFDELDVRLS